MYLSYKIFLLTICVIIFTFLPGCVDNKPPVKEPSPTVSQDIGTITVQGTVIDGKTKKPVTGVFIEIEKTKINCTTDSDGNYNLTNFPGKQTISFKKEGYKEQKVTRDIPGGEILTENILLLPIFENSNTPKEREKKNPLLLAINYYSNDLMVIDLRKNTVINNIPLGQDPEGITTSVEQNTAYISNSGNNTLTVIDTSGKGSPKGYISTGKTPKGIIATESCIYTANSASDSVSVIDIKQNREITSISVGKMPTGIITDDKKRYIYVLNSRSDSVSVINPAFNSIEKTIQTGTFPCSGAISPSGQELYVVNQVSEDVTVINLDKDEKISDIPVGKSPKNSIIAGGNKLYVTNYQDNTVSVIDCKRKEEIKQINVGKNPVGLAYWKEKNRLYVSNGTSNNISVIDVLTDTVTGEISKGNFPYNMIIIQ